MALSEREQKLLEEMERQLYQSDADVLDTSRAKSGATDYRKIVVGVVVATAGLGLLLAGVMLNFLVVGVVGFAAMLFGVLLSVTPSRKDASVTPRAAGKTSRSQRGKRTASFTDRMEQRWDERGSGLR